ncbi:pyruvate kinase [Arenibacter sp. 6A1]|uniref:pyruvate kinase n=1 Tax=Arenibacter sp. 6A1 TaxID=2720391 RepID=UPI001448724C|nr:pyruvate kinase [Arenibacter sp. 6A1]NKI27130.1 pyruvate kinase [Arenibacter sp. 6A1]
MEALKIGDKVYNVRQDGFTDFLRFSFSEVVRLTKTLAVLENGVRLVNQPRISWIRAGASYSVFGDKWVYWHIVTEETLQKAKEENEKIAASIAVAQGLDK